MPRFCFGEQGSILSGNANKNAERRKWGGEPFMEPSASHKAFSERSFKADQWYARHHWKISGYRPTLVRPPYGGINDELRSQMKMDVALWDVDPEDWKDRNKNNCWPCHESGGRWKNHFDSRYLPHLCWCGRWNYKKLTDQGYQLVTVSQLEEVKNKEKRNKLKRLSVRTAFFLFNKSLWWPKHLSLVLNTCRKRKKSLDLNHIPSVYSKTFGRPPLFHCRLQNHNYIFSVCVPGNLRICFIARRQCIIHRDFCPSRFTCTAEFKLDYSDDLIAGIH